MAVDSLARVGAPSTAIPLSRSRSEVLADFLRNIEVLRNRFFNKEDSASTKTLTVFTTEDFILFQSQCIEAWDSIDPEIATVESLDTFLKNCLEPLTNSTYEINRTRSLSIEASRLTSEFYLLYTTKYIEQQKNACNEEVNVCITKLEQCKTSSNPLKGLKEAWAELFKAYRTLYASLTPTLKNPFPGENEYSSLFEVGLNSPFYSNQYKKESREHLTSLFQEAEQRTKEKKEAIQRLLNQIKKTKDDHSLDISFYIKELETNILFPISRELSNLHNPSFVPPSAPQTTDPDRTHSSSVVDNAPFNPITQEIDMSALTKADSSAPSTDPLTASSTKPSPVAEATSTATRPILSAPNKAIHQPNTSTVTKKQPIADFLSSLLDNQWPELRDKPDLSSQDLAMFFDAVKSVGSELKISSASKHIFTTSVQNNFSTLFSEVARALLSASHKECEQEVNVKLSELKALLSEHVNVLDGHRESIQIAQKQPPKSVIETSATNNSELNSNTIEAIELNQLELDEIENADEYTNIKRVLTDAGVFLTQDLQSQFQDFQSICTEPTTKKLSEEIALIQERRTSLASKIEQDLSEIARKNQERKEFLLKAVAEGKVVISQKTLLEERESTIENATQGLSDCSALIAQACASAQKLIEEKNGDAEATRQLQSLRKDQTGFSQAHSSLKQQLSPSLEKTPVLDPTVVTSAHYQEALKELEKEVISRGEQKAKELIAKMDQEQKDLNELLQKAEGTLTTVQWTNQQKASLQSLGKKCEENSLKGADLTSQLKEIVNRMRALKEAFDKSEPKDRLAAVTNLRTFEHPSFIGDAREILNNLVTLPSYSNPFDSKSNTPLFTIEQGAYLKLTNVEKEELKNFMLNGSNEDSNPVRGFIRLQNESKEVATLLQEALTAYQEQKIEHTEALRFFDLSERLSAKKLEIDNLTTQIKQQIEKAKKHTSAPGDDPNVAKKMDNDICENLYALELLFRDLEELNAPEEGLYSLPSSLKKKEALSEETRKFLETCKGKFPTLEVDADRAIGVLRTNTKAYSTLSQGVRGMAPVSIANFAGYFVPGLVAPKYYEEYKKEKLSNIEGKSPVLETSAQEILHDALLEKK